MTKDADQQARIEDMLLSLRRLVGNPAAPVTGQPQTIPPDRPPQQDGAPPRKTVVLGPDLRCDRPGLGAAESRAGHAPGPAAPDRGPPNRSAAPEPPSNLFAGAALPASDQDLRLLVATLLREELSGPFGERLSVRLRDLVREEIARALTDPGR